MESVLYAQSASDYSKSGFSEGLNEESVIGTFEQLG